MNIDLRGARERAGLSQSELGAILGLSQAQISRYEQEPGSIPAELLLRWVQALGADLATLMAGATPLPSPSDPGDPYIELRQHLDLLEQFVTSSFPSENLGIPKNQKPPTLEDIKKQINRYRQKPNLVLVGRFDSGKSRLANALMGSKALPSQYQPATRVITFVRHVSDRPAWFQEQVGILGEKFWPKDEKNNQVFDLGLLDSQSWFEKHCVKDGSLEILRQHGVHDHFSQSELEGHSAVVYVDSPILRACNIVDFPGYSDKEEQVSEDVKKANSAAQIADLILYVSPMNGFMDAEDFSRLSYLLRVLPAPETQSSSFPILGNLFIVGTHAHPGISGLEIARALETGSVRLYNHVESLIQERSQLIKRPIKREHLQSRFFAFWEEMPGRWNNMKRDLTSVLGQSLPKARRNRIDYEFNLLRTDVPKQIAAQIQAYEQEVSEGGKRQQELRELEREEPERQSTVKQKRQQLHRRIAELRDKTEKDFRQDYNNMLDVDSIEAMLRKRYSKDKDEAKKYGAGYLVEQLQSRLESRIKENSDKLKVDIDEFLRTAYEEVLLKFPKLNIGSVSIPFDAKGAFLSGLAGIGGVGALAFWAASLGNLGAYILVAKFVSLLSAIGISISGGVATAVSFVAAIGGPITLAIGIGAALIALGWALFGESWERRLAKKIAKHFQENQVLDKFLQGNREYWRDTARAFDLGADSVEEQFQEHIQHLRDLSANDEFSRKKVKTILLLLEKIKDFFTGIPWAEFVDFN